MGSGSGSLRGGDRLQGVKGSSGRRVEGEGDVLAGASGSPSPLDAKRKRTRRKVLLNALPFRGRSPADLLPSSWSAKEKKREREVVFVEDLGFAIPEFKFGKNNLFAKDF
jgi:hypothetical protein